MQPFVVTVLFAIVVVICLTLLVVSFSLMSITYGTTSVYPSRGFDPGAVLTAIQQEKYVEKLMKISFTLHFLLQNILTRSTIT